MELQVKMDFRDTGQGADDMTADMITDVLEKVAEAAKAEIADTKKAASTFGRSVVASTRLQSIGAG